MIIVLALECGRLYRGLEPLSCKTKEYKIDICYFSAKYAAFMRKSKKKNACLGNPDNVSEWIDISTCWLLYQWASTVQIYCSVLVQYKADIIIISLNVAYSRHDIQCSWKIALLVLNNIHPLTPISKMERLIIIVFTYVKLQFVDVTRNDKIMTMGKHVLR